MWEWFVKLGWSTYGISWIFGVILLGLDPLQRLWENVRGEFPHSGAQVLRMQILQHKADARRACFMLIKDCWDGEMTDLLAGDQRYLYLKIHVQQSLTGGRVGVFTFSSLLFFSLLFFLCSLPLKYLLWWALLICWLR